jgi:hypothetical protein
MGHIQVFGIEFSGMNFAVSRDFTGGYTLRAGDYSLPITPQTAKALADGGRNIRLRAQVAEHFDREMKPGATFRRSMLSVDGRTVSIELGVADGGDGVYVEIGTARMSLTIEQAQLLLAVLDQLAADVSSIASATEQPVQLNLTPGLRNMPPRWMRD